MPVKAQEDLLNLVDLKSPLSLFQEEEYPGTEHGSGRYFNLGIAFQRR